MKKLITCGMLLGLLSTVSFAQRGRAAAGVGPSAGMSNSAPMARSMPNAVTTSHQGVAPSAVAPNHRAKTVAPNAASTPNAKGTTTVAPNAKSATAPDARSVHNRVMVPDADGLGTQPRINPNQ